MANVKVAVRARPLLARLVIECAYCCRLDFCILALQTVLTFTIEDYMFIYKQLIL